MLVGEVAPASITRRPGSVWRRFRSAAHPPEYLGYFGPYGPVTEGLISVFFSNRRLITRRPLARAMEVALTRLQIGPWTNQEILCDPTCWSACKSEHSPGRYDRNRLASARAVPTVEPR